MPLTQVLNTKGCCHHTSLSLSHKPPWCRVVTRLSKNQKTDHLWGPPRLPFSGCRGQFQGIKWPGREIYSSPPPSTKIKNVWSYTSTPPFVFVAWCLFKHRDFTLLSTHTNICARPKLLSFHTLP